MPNRTYNGREKTLRYPPLNDILCLRTFSPIQRNLLTNLVWTIAAAAQQQHLTANT